VVTFAAMTTSQQRPIVTELRLSAFKSHRGATFALDPITLLAGASGTGKSSVLEGLAVLGRLASGADLREVFTATRGRSVVRGGAEACVPQGARPDAQGRRGFRIGCTATGPLGPVRLDVAVQVEPTLRIVGERLTGAGETLLTTALRDPSRPTVQAAWHTAGAVAVTRAPLPDDQLATALLPLRVSGRTEGQRLVLAAAEQLVVALRGVFPIAPRPERMRGPVRLGDGRLRSACDNLSAVLARTEGECGIRHGMLVKAVGEVCSGPVEGLTTLPALLPGDGRGPAVDAVIAAVNRGPLGMLPVDRLGDGELRFLALALVLLTGPGVLDVDTSTELLPAGQVLTVVADGFDLGLDRRQARELLRLAGLAAARGHIRLLGTVQDVGCAEGLDGVTLTVVGAEPVGGGPASGALGGAAGGAGGSGGSPVSGAADGETLEAAAAGPGTAEAMAAEALAGDSGAGERGVGVGEFEAAEFGSGDFEVGDFMAGELGAAEFGPGEHAAVEGEDGVDRSA
jgi:hypothetical protein